MLGAPPHPQSSLLPSSSCPGPHSTLATQHAQHVQISLPVRLASQRAAPLQALLSQPTARWGTLFPHVPLLTRFYVVEHLFKSRQKELALSALDRLRQQRGSGGKVALSAGARQCSAR